MGSSYVDGNHQFRAITPRDGGRRAAVPLQRRPGHRARTPLAGPLGGRPRLRDTQPGGRSRRSGDVGIGRRAAVRIGHVPVPVGLRPARRPPTRVHRHRRLYPLPADGWAQRAVHDGLRRLRAACRAVRRADRPAPGCHDGVQRRQLPQAAAPVGDEPRPAARDRDHRPRLLPVDAVDLRPHLRLLVRPRRHRARRRGRASPPDRRARRRVRGRHPADAGRAGMVVADAGGVRRGHRPAAPGIRRRGAGQLVPRPRDGRRQRGGHRRRPQRPWQLPRVQADHAPVDDAHHGVRRPSTRRSRSARLDRRLEDDPTQLDRPLHRGTHRLRLPRRADLRVHDSA